MERLTGCSAVGSALGSGPRGRGFKSPHSDQKSTGFNKKPVDLFYIPDAYGISYLKISVGSENKEYKTVQTIYIL